MNKVDKLLKEIIEKENKTNELFDQIIKRVNKRDGQHIFEITDAIRELCNQIDKIYERQ